MGWIRTLIVDDSATYRMAIADALGGIRSAALVGFARNGREALEKIPEAKPDLVTLDLEMPVMGGLEALAAIRGRHPGVAVVMVSAATSAGARETLAALEAGAFHFLAKPEAKDRAASLEELRRQLEPLFDSLLQAKEGRSRPAAPADASPHPQPQAAASEGPPPEGAPPLGIVAVGASTGGPNALAEVLRRLPAGYPAPIVIAQHMPPVFTASLAESLQKGCALPVSEGRPGQELEPGAVYLAPGGRQMRVRRHPGGRVLIDVNDDPPERHCRPSVDYLFRSVADAFGAAAVGVILTGMGNDGTAGLRRMKEAGALVLGQQEAGCVVYGMPRSAREAGVVDRELSLAGIAAQLAARAARAGGAHG